MDMIEGPIDDQRLATDFTCNAAEIRVQVVLDFARDNRHTPFGTEYKMNEQIGGCVRHVFRPFRASRRNPSPGAYAPGSILLPLCGCGRVVFKLMNPAFSIVVCLLTEHFEFAETQSAGSSKLLPRHAQNVRSNVRYWMASAMCLG